MDLDAFMKTTTRRLNELEAFKARVEGLIADAHTEAARVTAPVDDDREVLHAGDTVTLTGADAGEPSKGMSGPSGHDSNVAQVPEGDDSFRNRIRARELSAEDLVALELAGGAELDALGQKYLAVRAMIPAA